jgi:uncharacterized protein (DUF983 family)
MIQHFIYSIFKNKCPKCNKGNVFTVNNAYNLKQFYKMEEECSCCGIRYEKEPGFFYGAMYVSYALMVGWFVITWAIDSFFIHSKTLQYVTFVMVSVILLMPLTFRISRLLWLNFFIKYSSDACTSNPSKLA